MVGFRLSAQKPPEARRINDDVVMRFDHVYEVNPEKMLIFPQQDIPAWDTLRIVASPLGSPRLDARPLGGQCAQRRGAGAGGPGWARRGLTSLVVQA